ncbi:CmpA/NrtA family ABC transporter substrate-binding protein [Plastoroseomonas arctica]|uniref:ABC transporter substrate-binding protein n=1 Tax=Plastoroseomonas arctica TaxID=1509237 RepID=A0AAF1JXL5_9PROT|nr:CmpA/NrtA family ABC transporter substrate-binding protein [Plastoroseomonas arctica]MBR0656281.1 ABC transporter substrate-binding protein [Plastoroseomonas arctica]
MALAVEALPRPLRPPPRLHALRVGYVPLVDAAPLLVAEAIGLFEAVGLRVTLSPESGWAAIRDKVSLGLLDGAHLLGPMPIALACGLGGLSARLSVACGLGANGNALTLSNALADAVAPEGASLTARAFGDALRASGRVPTIAVVFPFSSHNYLLRHWLASGGIDPDRDLRMTVVPPPQAAARLAEGAIDGFCAGAPWGSHAEALGCGRMVLGSGEIWPDHPEKVLAFAEAALERAPEAAIGCTAAVIAAARWIGEAGNRAELLRILTHAMPHLSGDELGAAIDGRVPGPALHFHDVTFPRRDAAAWWLAQMRRWGHVGADVAADEALAPYGSALWHAAAARVGEPEPSPASPPPEFSREILV